MAASCASPLAREAVGLVEFLLADGARVQQRPQPRGLLFPVGQVGLPRGPLRFERAHRGLLPAGVDLHQHGALAARGRPSARRSA